MKFIGLAAVAALAGAVSGETYFTEEFSTPAWEDKWVKTGDDKYTGSWEVTAGDWYGDAEANKALKTVENAHHFGISAKTDKVFDNDGKDLVFQMTVKHNQKLDCGGGYFKLMAPDVDLTTMNGDTEYAVMFGPDVCGPSNKKIHLIFSYKGQNLLWKKKPAALTDQLTHVYTLVLKPDNTYQVLVDLEEVESGSLDEDWDFLEPKTIDDPSAEKPADYPEPTIVDEDDTKPEDWDDEAPEVIPDPDATMPDDWEEEDGVWEPRMVPNPAYKGVWKPKKIPNPAYTGPWKHPQIPNPAYDAEAAKTLYKRGPVGVVSTELWQVTAGTAFDNILLTDSLDEAKAHAEAKWRPFVEGEKKMFEEKEDARREEERKAREAAEAASKAAADDDEDDAGFFGGNDDDEDDEDDVRDEL